MDTLALILFAAGLVLILFGIFFVREQSQPARTTGSPAGAQVPVTVPAYGSAAAQPAGGVAVQVAGRNPSLYRRDGYLYLDTNPGNRYDGNASDIALHETNGIRRFGSGKLVYDGFAFVFEHRNGQERFVTDGLRQIAFYPNCVVLVPKSNVATALIFLDETESLRRVLETFRADEAESALR